MNKILQNISSTIVTYKDKGISILPSEEYNIPFQYQQEFAQDNEVLDSIRNGFIQVGNGDEFYSDVLEGEAYIRTMFGSESYIVNGSSLDLLSPEIVEDVVSGKKGVAVTMSILGMMKDLYNASTDPLYDSSFQPLLGSSGREVEHINRTANLENIHSNIGWHLRDIEKRTYQKPKNTIIYYGYPNSFNSNINVWNNENVAHDLKQFDIIVLGNGIADSSHGDYSNTSIIISRVKVLNPSTKIFGYVSVNQTQTAFESEVDEWEILQVDGIFLTEAGYDYGTTTTNSRSAFNTKIDYVHEQTYANICFVNAWEMDHIIGTANDTSYPNTTWNTSGVESNLNSYDWYLLNSFAIDTTSYSARSGYELPADWNSRGQKAITHRYNYGINISGFSIINNSDVNGQHLFDFGYLSATMYGLEAYGSSANSYGSSAIVTKWNRPNVTQAGYIWEDGPVVKVDTSDSDIYTRRTNGATFTIDFSSSSEYTHIDRDVPIIPQWENYIYTSNITLYDSIKLKLDSSISSFIIYLPENPKPHMEIYFLDVTSSCGTNSITINRNSNLINGSASNESLSTNGQSLILVWAGSTNGWITFG